jgi:hypothetical protein
MPRTHRPRTHPRRLVPPLALACLAAAALLRPAGLVVAQEINDESVPDIEFRCERMGVQFMMQGWVIFGTCEYRFCHVVDEDGYPWTFGGVPVTWFEADCGPLGTHAPDDDTPGAS